MSVAVVGVDLGGTKVAAAPLCDDRLGDSVVRATSQAAYQTGKAHLDRGEFLAACVDLDKAKVADPDNRPEIQGPELPDWPHRTLPSGHGPLHPVCRDGRGRRAARANRE